MAASETALPPIFFGTYIRSNHVGMIVPEATTTMKHGSKSGISWVYFPSPDE